MPKPAKHRPSKDRKDRYVEVDSTYVNSFMNLRVTPDLLKLRILSRLPNACKEITKCMAVFRALIRVVGEERFDDDSVHCVVVEHGPKVALTGFLIGYITKWKVVIVNPNNDLYKALSIPNNIWCIKGRIENVHLSFDRCNTLVVVTAHSIGGDFKAINYAWDKVESPEKLAISIPLTEKMECDGYLVNQYIDEHIVSLSDEVRIWRPHN